MMAQQSLVEQMLNTISASRSSMERQIAAMADVLDKSNNALLQIEASRSIKPTISDSNGIPFTFNRETVNALTKIVDKCIHMLTARDNAPAPDTRGICLEDYMEAAGLRAEYLSCSIRKMLAVWNVVQQMRIVLQRHEMDLDDSNEEKEMLY